MNVHTDIDRVPDVQAEPRAGADAPAGAHGGDARTWLAAIVDSSPDAVAGLSPTGIIRSWNAGAERLYGLSRVAAVGQPVSVLTPPELFGERGRGFARTLAGEAEFVREDTEDLRADGTRIPVTLTLSPIRDEAGRTVGIARIARDSSERRRLERDLRWGSEHDPLTGLFNRRRFEEELAREVDRAIRYPVSAGSVLLADIDRFKAVNDGLGHRAGDEVVKAVVQVLSARLRATDVLAAGSAATSSAMLLPHTRPDDAWVVACSLCEAIRREVSVADGLGLRTTVSIGVAPLGGGITGEDSMAIADMAMYEAKRHGRDRAVTFGRQPHRLRDQLDWAERLREALAAQHFTLYAQPIVDLATGASDRDELLLRLREPDGRVVSPKAFIGPAERFGLIGEIDRWVIRSAAALLGARVGAERGVTINLSARSMGEPGTLELIAGELEAARIDRARLAVEVDAAAASADPEIAREFVLGVHEIGCGSELDTFGSGPHTFECLREVPVDMAKIDGALVRRLPGGKRDRALVRAIVDATHAFGVRVGAVQVAGAQALDVLRRGRSRLCPGPVSRPVSPCSPRRAPSRRRLTVTGARRWPRCGPRSVTRSLGRTAWLRGEPGTDGRAGLRGAGGIASRAGPRLRRRAPRCAGVRGSAAAQLG